MWLPAELQGVSPCSSRLSLLIGSRRAARVARGGVGLQHPEHDLRGPARAARPRDARPHAAGDPRLRRRPRARARLLAGLRARAEVQDAPGLRRRPTPAPTRPARGTGSTACSAAPPRAASPSSSRSPARCRSGRRRRSATTSRSRSPKEFEAFATAVGRRYGDRVGLWSIWNEPNHPQFLRPQFVKKRAKSPRIYRKLFLAGQRGLRRLRQRRRHAAVRRDRPARHAARRRAARVPARRAVPEQVLQAQGQVRADQRRRLRPPRLHHARRPALPPARQGRRDDRRARRASRPRSTRPARPGAITRGLGIYLTEFGIQSTPDPFVGVSLAKQAEYLAISEHMAYVNPRVKSFSQYLLGDDQPAQGQPRRALQRLRVRPAPLQRQGQAVLRRVPAAAGGRVLRPVRRPLGPRAAVGGADARSRSSPQRRKGKPFKPLRTVTDEPAAASSACARKHHDKQRYRVQWTAPDGKVWRGPPIRANVEPEPFRAPLRRARREAGRSRSRSSAGAWWSGCCRRWPRTSRVASATSPSRPRASR